MMITTTTTPAVQPLRPSPDHDWDSATQTWVLKTLDAIKALASSRMDQMHGSALESAVGFPTATEKDTWTLKLETAKAVQAKTAISSAGVAFLASAGLATDAQKTDWAARVVANADTYAKAVGKFEKWRSDARAAIWAATNYEALQKAETSATTGILSIK